jgi:hypothetical protein
VTHASAGDRVTLTRNGAAGAVKGRVGDDAAYVRLDSGTSCTFSDDELEPETKAWPPRGIETK